VPVKSAIVKIIKNIPWNRFKWKNTKKSCEEHVEMCQ
jgi:hypothetical protein